MKKWLLGTQGKGGSSRLKSQRKRMHRDEWEKHAKGMCRTASCKKQKQQERSRRK